MTAMTCAGCNHRIVPAELHERTVAELRSRADARETDLLTHNNALLERARAAERARDDYWQAIGVLTQLCARLANPLLEQQSRRS